MKTTAIIIPTTAGLRRVCSARFREELPVSLIRLDGSFAPFSQSQAAHQLVDGPLRRLSPAGHSFDLALDGDIEDGRSWELGFACAWSFARFWPEALCAEPENAERLLWVTGAIDMDLAPQAASYFIADKLKLSASLFEQTRDLGLEIVVATPPSLGGNDEAALDDLANRDPNIQVLRPASLQALLDALEGTQRREAEAQANLQTRAAAVAASGPLPQTVPIDERPAASQAARPSTLARTALPLAAGLLLLTLTGLGALWFFAGNPQPLTLSLIAHHLSDDKKSCGDVIFGQAELSPAVQTDMTSGDNIAISTEGLCQLEIINTSTTVLEIALPPALSRLALHDMFRQEGKIRMTEGARLAVLVSAFPPKQRMVMSASAASGAVGEFILDFK